VDWNGNNDSSPFLCPFFGTGGYFKCKRQTKTPFKSKNNHEMIILTNMERDDLFYDANGTDGVMVRSCDELSE
jgi:hypothetical protein